MVDLPAPERPTTAVDVPRFSSRVSSLSTVQEERRSPQLAVPVLASG